MFTLNSDNSVTLPDAPASKVRGAWMMIGDTVTVQLLPGSDGMVFVRCGEDLCFLAYDEEHGWQGTQARMVRQ